MFKRSVGASNFGTLALKDSPLTLLESQALGRLTTREAYDRAFRIKQASQASVLHSDLPKGEWLPVSEVGQNQYSSLKVPQRAFFFFHISGQTVSQAPRC